MDKNHQITQHRPLILASQSPRRLMLLKHLGVPFRQFPIDYHEPPYSGGNVLLYGYQIALGKYRQCCAANETPGWILVGDTFVVVDGRILGKPANIDAARRMLEQIENKTHFVVSCVLLGDSRKSRWSWAPAISAVTMGRFLRHQREAYLQTSEPYDKAGAYAIQGWAGKRIVSLRGSRNNVMGLPTFLLPYLFQRCGLAWRYRRPTDGPQNWGDPDSVIS